MRHLTTREQRKARDADFERRMQPRPVWNSTQDGTAVRFVDKHGNVTYTFKKVVAKRKATLTEAQDNAIGRAIRRRENRRRRAAGKPHSSR